MNTPSPNPAAFDGHWLTRAEITALTGSKPSMLDWLRGGGWHRRGYDAGKVLAARQQERR